MKTQKAKSKSSDGRKQLSSVRVIQRNLVYIVGLPLNLADEDVKISPSFLLSTRMFPSSRLFSFLLDFSGSSSYFNHSLCSFFSEESILVSMGRS